MVVADIVRAEPDFDRVEQPEQPLLTGGRESQATTEIESSSENKKPK